MSDSHVPLQNQLLAALPQLVYERLLPHIELVRMPLGETLYEFGSELRHVYFPTTALVSLLYVMRDGASAEIAGVGNEGIVGVATFTGGDSMPNRAMVLCAGHAYRLKSQLLKEEFNRAGALRNLLLRYTQALMTQISQNAVCNRHHSVEQQLSRWLLSSLDRLPSNELTMTQELIASTFGVRREGITEAAGKLKRAGHISCRRGHITVLDRSGLEKLACECYQVVKNEFHRLLTENPAQTSHVECRNIMPLRDALSVHGAPPPDRPSLRAFAISMAIRDELNLETLAGRGGGCDILSKPQKMLANGTRNRAPAHKQQSTGRIVSGDMFVIAQNSAA